ncbi:MAG: CAP domain-containing protein, partial [Tateyamaria sp.]
MLITKLEVWIMSVASTFERQMLDLINAERASVGVAPLALELRLNDASEDHSVWMDQSLTFSHTGTGGSDPGDRMRASGFEFEGQWTWGENIAYQSERGAPGIADDVVDLHTALMNSPGHRANILNPNFDLIGIGIEVGDNRGFDAVYVTQNFAATAAPVQLDTGGSSPTPPGILFGTNGNDRLDGTAGADEIRTGNGDDRLDGLGGDDTIHGGAGSDSIAAGAGNDRVFGGAQHDT